MSWIDSSTFKWLPMNFNPVRRVEKPLTVFLVADNHRGRQLSNQNIVEFVEMANEHKPDAVLHLGDVIEGTITNSYEYETDEEAALKQLDDFYDEWKEIDTSIPNDIALGNRDVATQHGYPLDEDVFVNKLGYQDRPLIGNSKMQTSFIVDNGYIKALFIVLSTYAPNVNKEDTTDWLIDEIKGFDGDQVLIIGHHIEPYDAIRDKIISNYIRTPVLFLHGHNHPQDTLDRDKWGSEVNKLDFPSYCLTNLFRDGVALSIELHKGGFPGFPVTYELGGYHKLYRIDTNAKTFGEPTINYQGRVENGGSNY